MADLKLERPQPGARLEISANADDNIIFGFDINETVMSREVNDPALTFTFGDGSTTVITNFYAVYTSDNMPDFIINDQIVSGETFFASFDENLMPAAGQEQSQNTPRSSDSVEFNSDSIDSGNYALAEVYVKSLNPPAQTQNQNYNTEDAENSFNLFASNESTKVDSSVVYVAPIITQDKDEVKNVNLEAGVVDTKEYNNVNQNFTATDEGKQAVFDDHVSNNILVASNSNGNSFLATATENKISDNNGSFHGSLDVGSMKVENKGGGASFTMNSVKVTVTSDPATLNSDHTPNVDMNPTVEEFGKLSYVSFSKNAGECSGISVASGKIQDIRKNTGTDWDTEIGANKINFGTTVSPEYVSEGIEFKISGDHPVQNITLSLSSFFVSWADVEGRETATIYFYKGDSKTAFYSEQIASQKDSAGADTGRFIYEGYVADGFDRVVVKPNPLVDDKFGSSFLVESISFSESIFPEYTGKLNFDLGTGAGAGGIAFALEDKSTLETDQGKLDISIVKDSDTSSVTMTGTHHDDDDGFKKGSEAFTATLDPNGEWTFESTQDITVNKGEDFKLGFEVTGKNGSTANTSVELDVIVIDSYKAGTADADTISGSNTKADDYIKGFAGDDTISGNDGDDKLFGDDGNDKLFGNDGDDTIFGGEGNDIITGGAGADELYGGNGHDIIHFDLDDLIVNGNEGNDVAIGGNIDGILTHLKAGKIDNVELFLTGDGSTSIADMGDLDNIGISFDSNGKVNFDNSEWTQVKTSPVTDKANDTTNYVEVTSGTGESQITALVDEAVFKLSYTN